MLWLKAFHVIAVVCWFAGLFYLPRLFVYHAMTDNTAVKEQLKIMEYRLYYYIMHPAFAATLIFGFCLWLPHYHHYSHALWLHIKLGLVALLVIFHIYCGQLLRQFRSDSNHYHHRFYRIFNEIPTVILIAIVLLSYLKP